MSALTGEKDFVAIREGEKVYYGGNQEWYDTKLARSAGCGAIAASNILAYMAAKNPRLRALYPYGDWEKRNYLHFMNRLYGYLRPWRFFHIPLGLWHPFLLSGGILAYGRERGIALLARIYKGPWRAAELSAYIEEALEKDLPLALMVAFSGKKMKVISAQGQHLQGAFAFHWVTVCGLEQEREGQRLWVSSWGGRYSFLLQDYLRSFPFYGAVLYFEEKRQGGVDDGNQKDAGE